MFEEYGLEALGILFCISQSAMFSGLNLAILGISRLRLEVEAASNNTKAIKILTLRKDFNFLLTTILWGNVSINVILALLSNSIMTGVTAFVFSTFVITFGGEIIPQAYFSRHAIKMGAMLTPILRIYQIILYPVAKPTAIILDWWLGEEGIRYYREKDLRAVIRKHIEAKETDINKLEGIGALNFLALDDITVTQEGEEIAPASIITLPVKNELPEFPKYLPNVDDPFVKKINFSGKKWIIIVDKTQIPVVVLNANEFLRNILFHEEVVNPLQFCHRPILVKDEKTLLGKVLPKFKVYADSERDDVVDDDLILVWSNTKKVITGSDILGRLLRGIALRDIHKRLAV